MKPTKQEFVAYYLIHTRKETMLHFGLTEHQAKALTCEYECCKDIRKPRPDKEDFATQYLIKTMKE